MNETLNTAPAAPAVRIAELAPELVAAEDMLKLRNLGAVLPSAVAVPPALGEAPALQDPPAEDAEAVVVGATPSGLVVQVSGSLGGPPDGDNPEAPPSTFNDYVVGYAFSPDGTQVALIEKLRPEWQAGKYNGIGGKIKSGELAMHAMAREFGEETGVYISADRWLHFRTEEFYNTGDDGGTWVRHYVVKTTPAEWDAIHTATDEKVVKLPYPLPETETRNLVYNMPYLVPMAYVLLHAPDERRPAP